MTRRGRGREALKNSNGQKEETHQLMSVKGLRRRISISFPPSTRYLISSTTSCDTRMVDFVASCVLGRRWSSLRSRQIFE